MKILKLTLKKKWFDMILSGEKKEEYREIKRYWIQRFCDEFKFEIFDPECFKHFDLIEFSNGYGHKVPKFTIKCEGFKISKGNTLWGAEPNMYYFVVKLGHIVSTSNLL